MGNQTYYHLQQDFYDLSVHYYWMGRVPDCKKHYNLALKLMDMLTSKFNKITSQKGIRLASYATRNFLVSHSCWIMEPCNCKNLGKWKRQHLVKVIMQSVTLSILWKQSRDCKCLTLKWHRVLMYVHLHNLCGFHKVHKSYHVCLCDWNPIIDIVFCNHPNIYICMTCAHVSCTQA